MADEKVKKKKKVEGDGEGGVKKGPEIFCYQNHLMSISPCKRSHPAVSFNLYRHPVQLAKQVLFSVDG